MCGTDLQRIYIKFQEYHTLSVKSFVYKNFAVYLQCPYAETIIKMVGKSACNGRCEHEGTIYGRSVYLSLVS